jgi:DNA-binding XRE family transcriptional regulator
MNAIKILDETADTVTVSKADWEGLLEALEDAEDVAAVAARRAHESEVGKNMARRNYLPIEMAERILGGETPLKVYREHNKMTVAALASASGVSGSYISEIETGRKPGSVDALTKLAKALGLMVDDLVG